MVKNIRSVLWESNNLPEGLTINANTGVISGTPQVDPGVYTAIIKATNNYGSASGVITINVAMPSSWLPTINAETVTINKGETMNPYTVKGNNITLN